jgi:hypothetical protein
MPDITAFSRMLVHDRRQFSTDSENSNYKVAAGSSGGNNAVQLHQQQQTTICYQCHGAGHVTVPAVIPADNNCRQQMPPYVCNTLPRDVTTSTLCSAAVTTPGDEEFTARTDMSSSSHQHRRSRAGITWTTTTMKMMPCFFYPRHQRSHSSGTNYDGSLRRITAV